MASGSFSLTNTGNTSRYVRIDVNWSSRWSNLSENTSYIDVIVNVVKLPGSTQATSGKYNMTITADNQTLTIPNTSFSVSPNSTLEIANVSLPVQHNADGTKSCTLSVNVGGNVMWANGSQYITLDTIPRYATITHSSGAKTETSITMNWNTDASINKLWYSTDNGSSYTEVSNVSGTSGNYTISGLNANTNYNIKTKVRRADSGLDSESGVLGVSTYDYPKAQNLPNFIIGDNPTFSLYNPLGRTCSVVLKGDDNSTIASSTTSSTSITNLVDTTNLYASIPNKQVGSYKIEVSYSSQTKTTTGGTYQIVVDDCIPEFSTITYEDTYSTTTAITGDNQVLISGNSKSTFNATGLSAKNSATITSAVLRQSSLNGYILGNMTISGTIASINNVIMYYSNTASKDVYVVITDSRGLTYNKKLTTGLVDYQVPTATYSVKRQSNYYSNTDFLVNANYSQIGSNSITIKTRQKQEGSSTWSNYTSLTSGTTTTISLDNEYYWNIEIELSDALNTKTYTTTIQRGTPVFYIDTIKNSLGVNCFPEYENDIEVGGSPISSKYSTTEVACGDWFGNTMYRVGEVGLVEDVIDTSTGWFYVQFMNISSLATITNYEVSLFSNEYNRIYKVPYRSYGATNSIIVDESSYYNHIITIRVKVGSDLISLFTDHTTHYQVVVYYTKTQG